MDNPSPLEKAMADIAAGESDDQSLAQFEQLACDNAAEWKRLALTLRDELELRSGLDRQLNSNRAQADREIANARSHQPAIVVRSLAAWSGWSLAAAMLLALSLVLVVQSKRGAGLPGNGSHGNGALLAGFTAQEALDRYITRGAEEGRIVAELPTVMVEARQLEEGVLEVLYLRQFLERERVNEVYTVASDELGMPHPVKVDFSGWDFADYSDSSL